ncbi:hypothetical protein DUNSADRAFT_1823 [Dunaliella salina]|uniref:Encoded protein n=1 Tax=Dunaliella salina TaxID=3046 RepID=A0ABQ7FWY9_DUNSA|nr:hypothetical protein DUNSADRAFT_1823 [Dunaliella salina]|eukprot:KAF5826877.1 hypothetical protein DUNSADRAFT_1823 [Dunaliella salina]
MGLFEGASSCQQHRIDTSILAFATSLTKSCYEPSINVRRNSCVPSQHDTIPKHCSSVPKDATKCSPMPCKRHHKAQEKQEVCL